jgi:hypothetical protein
MKTLLFALAFSLSAHATCELETPIKLSELESGTFTNVTVEALLNFDEEDVFEASSELQLSFNSGMDVLHGDREVLGAFIQIPGTKLSIGANPAVSEDLIKRIIFKNWDDVVGTDVHMVYELTSIDEDRKIRTTGDITIVGDEIRSIEFIQRLVKPEGEVDFEFYCVTRASR